MNARASLDEMREAEIRRLIPEHAAAIREKVAAGEAPIGLIADGVTDLLCDGKLAQQLVRLSVCVPIIGGSVLGFLAAHVIAEQAEIESIKEVEREEASITSRDRQQLECMQERAEISAAYGGNPPMY